MKENGSMIKQKEKVSIFIKMALLILENGSMISSMDTAIKNGPMVQSMKGTMSKV